MIYSVEGWELRALQIGKHTVMHNAQLNHRPLPANAFPCVAAAARYRHAIPWQMQLRSIIKNLKHSNVSLSLWIMPRFTVSRKAST